MYLEYHELLKKYKDAERRYNESLEERSKLILAVMPKATQAKEVMTSGGSTSPDWKLIDYASEIDEVDKLINQSRNTRDMLNYELKKLERQLKDSPDVKDRIYYYKWIKRLSPYKFYRQLGYTVRQIYRYIGEMKENLYRKTKMSQNVTNDMT